MHLDLVHFYISAFAISNFPSFFPLFPLFPLFPFFPFFPVFSIDLSPLSTILPFFTFHLPRRRLPSCRAHSSHPRASPTPSFFCCYMQIADRIPPSLPLCLCFGVINNPLFSPGQQLFRTQPATWSLHTLPTNSHHNYFRAMSSSTRRGDGQVSTSSCLQGNCLFSLFPDSPPCSLTLAPRPPKHQNQHVNT